MFNQTLIKSAQQFADPTMPEKAVVYTRMNIIVISTQRKEVSVFYVRTVDAKDATARLKSARLKSCLQADKLELEADEIDVLRLETKAVP